LERVLILYAIPVFAASFVLDPTSSFLFASISAASYTLLRLVVVGSTSYNVVSMPILFVLALVAWLVADRQERYIAARRPAEQTQLAFTSPTS